MTNLFYPSVVVWYQKRNPTTPIHDYQAGPSRIRNSFGNEHDNPLSVLSTPLLDSIFPDSPALLPRLSPRGWWYDEGDDDEAPRWNITSVKNREYYLGSIEDEEIRMVTIAWIDVEGALSWNVEEVEDEEDHTEDTQAITEAIQQRVENWEKDHPGSRERCIRELRSGTSGDVKPEGGCYLFSSDQVDGITRPFHEIASANTSDLDPPGIYRSVSALFRLPRSTSPEFSERWKATLGRISDEVGGKVFLGRKPQRDVPEEFRLSVRYLLPIRRIQTD